MADPVQGKIATLMTENAADAAGEGMWRKFKQGAQPFWKGTKFVGKGAWGLGKGLFSAAYHTSKFFLGTKTGRLATLVGAVGVGIASNMWDDVENTSPYGGVTTGVLQQIGGPIGLAGMAYLDSRDRTANMRGADFMKGAVQGDRPPAPVQGPMSFSGGGGGRLSGMNLGASGNLTLALSNLRRG